jgi:hypothetical protein
MSQSDGVKLVSAGYKVLRHIAAGSSSKKIELGNPCLCRFCGCSDRRRFRNEAHIFPEALGNHWVLSADECDDCNHKFSAYEGAISACLGPFLTLDGVRGKNGIRQTGRTHGPTQIQRAVEGGRPTFSIAVRDLPVPMQLSTSGGTELDIPIARESFCPRHAYKALCKMAYSLLPDEELTNFSELRNWLLDTTDNEDFPILEVALSVATVGDAPEMVTGTLLRRIAPDDHIPYIQFVFTTGSLSLRIDLLSDHKDDHLPCLQVGAIDHRWHLIVRSSDGAELTWDYSEPELFNWSGTENALQPIESVSFTFDASTCHGTFKPIFRDSPLLFRKVRAGGRS